MNDETAFLEDLRNRFLYHSPDERAQSRHEDVRTYFLTFAENISRYLPGSREKSLFLTSLEEAGFWAHAAIARHDAEGNRR